MSIEAVRVYMQERGREEDVLEFPVSSATVELAAQALNTQPARIAKTLSFKTPEEGCLLLVAAGDGKIDNRKFRETFGFKAKMLSPDEVGPMTGHEIGGVCPFANPAGVRVYLDESLRRFDTVFPACGSGNSAIRLTCEELEYLSNAIGWVDVCKGWQLEEGK